EVVERCGDALEVIGVRSGPTVLRSGTGTADRGNSGREDGDVLLTEALDGWDDYLAELADLAGGAADLPGLTAVADLDAVRPQAWPEVLTALTSGAAGRALVEPVRVGTARAPSYTAWWLRRRADLGLDRPFALGRQAAGPDADGPARAPVGA